MERKVITIRRRTGNGLTRCDYCGAMTWDCMTNDVIRYDGKVLQELKTICSQCMDEVRAYWLRRGYIVKEPAIYG